MSNVKLTLRPPPNVDFVHGYPGIPPGHERPQAVVKGAIEVRTPPSGVKAQWVRIELRKVETLPGGGDSNTFYDYVGPSPVTLWSAPIEYDLLRAQDFPFSIRIPESIPPSIALEGRAGIQYELVATVCTKGKRSFLRKRKNIVTKEIAPVTIDKHELHSTWPVYCQPETRQLAQEGVTLIVERNRTCYGPGDRISVVAALKSDSLHTVILRGFEMMLKESTIFRAHTFGGSRKTQPLVKSINVAETKVAINATLYGGTTHQAELVCQLSEGHTTTTLNAARHIDVTYVLSVKALMGTGTHVTMDLPVIVSNWQRCVSQEAIRRIGTAPALSLLPPSSSAPVMSIEAASHPRTQPNTANTLPSSAHGRTPSTTANQFTTLPASNISGRPGTTGTTNSATIDEFGYGVGYGKAAISGRQNSESKGNQDDSIISQAPSSTVNTSVAPGRRPNSARVINPAHRFTITNAEPEEPEDSQTKTTAVVNIPPVWNAVPPRAPQKQWPTAEEEKRAYELARSKVAKIQGTAAAPAPAPATIPTAVTNLPPSTKTPTPNAGRQWLSADEEKVLLYEKAQTAVGKAHRGAPDGRTPSGDSAGGSSKPSGSELYQQALANVNANQSNSSHVSPLSGGSRKSSAGPHKVPHYLTAEQEKEALKRYEEAKMAVDRVHNPYAEPAGPAPIAYDSLYPKTRGSSSATATAATTDAPPSFEASVAPSAAAVAPMSALAEKATLAERMRTTDAAPQNEFAAPPPSFTTATTTNNTQQQYLDAAAEKEALRKKLEAKDAAAAAKRARQQQQRQQQRNGSTHGVGVRPTPAPPTHAQILTAAEEKAMLKAKFEAKDVKVAQKKLNGHVNQRTPNTTTTTTTTPPPPSPQISFAQQQQQGMPSPPPLMPRPPAEYIQETQEEDARVSKFAIDGASLKLDEGEEHGGSGSGGVYLNGNGNGNVGVGVVRAPGPPPPLPPKPAGE